MPIPRLHNVRAVFTAVAPATPTDWEAYYHLRWTVMRAPLGQPPGSERDDLEASAFHRFIRDAGAVVATGRLHLCDTSTAQVRYMAVAESHQGRGLGRIILNALEEEARRQGVTRIWLNARITAVGFYANCGYADIGEGPTPFGIPHRVMEKALV